MRILVLIIFLFGACKAKKQLNLAELCAKEFPPKDSLVIRTDTIREVFTVPEEWFEIEDTTECPPSKEAITIVKTISKKVPPRIIEIERVVHDTTFFRPDSAALFLAIHELDKTKKKLAKAEKKLAKNNGKVKVPHWVIALLLLITGGGAVITKMTKTKLESP